MGLHNETGMVLVKHVRQIVGSTYSKELVAQFTSRYSLPDAPMTMEDFVDVLTIADQETSESRSVSPQPMSPSPSLVPSHPPRSPESTADPATVQQERSAGASTPAMDPNYDPEEDTA